jgi:hypothetical protein
MLNMRQLLKRHPDSVCLAVAHVEVNATRLRGGSLALSYIVTGKLDDISIPPVAATARKDELSRHTCFEAFVRAPSGNEYFEFNFSPSTHWAAYQFSGYRGRMCLATEISVPLIEVSSHPDRFTLTASLELDRLRGLQAPASWRLGLSAVIENRNGRKSYWALEHPPGKPDFHHAECFSGELSSTVRT